MHVVGACAAAECYQCCNRLNFTYLVAQILGGLWTGVRSSFISFLPLRDYVLFPRYPDECHYRNYRFVLCSDRIHSHLAAAIRIKPIDMVFVFVYNRKQ